MSDQSMQVVNGGHSHLPSTVGEIREQVNLIQQMMREVMKPNVHYGTIPGTDKPALYKPGAEKIGLTFRLAASFEVQADHLANGHREYTVTCRLTARDGTLVGEGIGVCSTMEGKYRYRWDATGQRVPQEYWETRDPAILGGPQYTVRKKDQVWWIYQRVDHDNPADYYNTVAKMAKKRAHVDATLTSTAASDIFDQDLDDPDGVPPEGPKDTGNGNAAPRPSARGGTLSEKQARLLRARLSAAELEEQALCEHFEVNAIESIPGAKVNDALEWIQKGGQA